jgi:chromosome segregation ATPase
MGLVIGILVLALAGSGYLLKASYERNGALVAAAEANERALEKAHERVEEVKLKYTQAQAQILALSDRVIELNQERDRIALRLEKWRATLDSRTLAKPEVTRRAARKALRLRQCKLWRDTGGIGDCPK